MEKVVLIDSDKVLESFSISEKRVPELMDFIVELLIKAQEDESSNIYVKNKEDGSYEFRGLKVAELLLNDFAKTEMERYYLMLEFDKLLRGGIMLMKLKKTFEGINQTIDEIFNQEDQSPSIDDISLN